MSQSGRAAFVVFGLAVGFSGCATSGEENDAPTAPVEEAASRTAEVLNAEAQAALTPAAVLAQLKEGNRRFVNDQLTNRDYLAQAEATASAGQFPKAIILGCLDSRVPPEIVFDQGIGDLFVGRVAGNFENTDMLGSLEFGAKVAGSKVIVVLGHTSCGAVKGAADAVELGNLTAMLDNFDEALATARESAEGAYDSSNDAYVTAAIEANVQQTIADIQERSEVLAEMVDGGELMIVGGIYNLASGAVTWLD